MAIGRTTYRTSLPQGLHRKGTAAPTPTLVKCAERRLLRTTLNSLAGPRRAAQSTVACGGMISSHAGPVLRRAATYEEPETLCARRLVCAFR
jgi:hypothetical protein